MLRLVSNIFCRFAPVILFLFIWIPVLKHYSVSIVIEDEMVSMARHTPSDEILNEIRPFFPYCEECGEQVVAVADKIVHGEFEIPGEASKRVSIPFDSNDLEAGTEQWRVDVGSFFIPSVLLSAYEASDRIDLLMSAKDVIVSMASYELRARVPKGSFWTDYCLSSRISVLSKFWKHYRKQADYEDEVGKSVFQLVARSAQLLAKSSHFKFSSNHGIMQNLALWQICIVFPTLPGVDHYKKLAFRRMRDQMMFYINDEGIVLEHSAGYHRAGLYFMGLAFRYLTLLNMPVPEEWELKYRKAKDFYAQIRRPDGSLPMFGDTHIYKDSHGPLVIESNTQGKNLKLQYKKEWSPSQSKSLYPIAGYSVWWDGLDDWPNQDKLSQTILSWSHFPRHAHKHADEMSVLLWAHGQTWWNNVGYWPYGTEGRAEAVSWAGSNAPHLLGEKKDSLRQTRLKFHGFSGEVAVIDLQRNGPGDYSARRQVIQIKPTLWIVVDHTLGNEKYITTTTWTTSHDVQLKEGAIPASYILETENNSARLTTFLLSSGRMKTMQFRGSFFPFAGWEYTRSAPAILIEQPADNSWTVAIWSIQDAIKPTFEFNGAPSMEYWSSPEDWKIRLPFSTGSMSVRREDDRIHVSEQKNGNRYSEKITKLSEGQGVTNALAEIQDAYQNAEKKYPLKKFHFRLHVKATYILLFIFLSQEIIFLVCSRFLRQDYKRARVLIVFGWIAAALYLFYRF